MTEIHAFDPDGTASPGAQAALSAFASTGDQRWVRRDSAPNTLGASVEQKTTASGVPYSVTRIYSHAGGVPGKSVDKAYGSDPYARIDVKPLDWYARQTGATVVTNASGYLSAGGARGLQIHNGVQLSDWDAQGPQGLECLAVMRDGTLRGYSKIEGDTGSAMISDGVLHTWSFGPIVARGGAVRDIDSMPEVFGFFTTTGAGSSRSARQIVGQATDGQIIIITVAGKSGSAGIVGNEMGALAVAEGCDIAVCMDGGGSAQTLVGGQYAAASSDEGARRAVADAFLIHGVSVASDPTDTGWRSLALGTSIEPHDPWPPEYRVKGGVLYFRGMIKKTDGFAASAAYQNVARIPYPHPSPVGIQSARMLPGHRADAAVRSYIIPGGNIAVVTGPVAPAYVDLSGLSGMLAD